MIHLHRGSGTDLCVPDVHVDSIAEGHRTATASSIPVKFPVPTNSAADITRNESVCLTRRHSVAPAPCRPLSRALEKAWVSLSSSASPGPGGRAVSGNCFSEVDWAAFRAWLASVPNFCSTFPDFMMTASCAASLSGSGSLEASPPSAPSSHSGQDPRMIPATASFVIAHVSRVSRQLPRS